jgi:hypothetical protein
MLQTACMQGHEENVLQPVGQVRYQPVNFVEVARIIWQSQLNRLTAGKR